MSPRVYSFLLAVGLCSALLVGCELGTGAKTLGKKAVGGTGTGASDADSFSVTLAYRNPGELTADARRTVSVQGIRGVPSANFVTSCGATGATCTCLFYSSSTDTAPVASTTVGISAQNNSFSCVIPPSITDAQINANLIKYVMLKRTDVENNNSGLIDLKTELKIEDVLGTGQSKLKVRGIYKYNCGRTFFEGEGVSAGQITCYGGQRLGVISATYNFYTYRSGEDSNSGGGDTAFLADICQRNSFLKIQCSGNVPDLRYGLYKISADPFLVGVTMTRAPEGENLTAIYGYAALPDSAGNCPTGLVKARPWLAQPASIIQGSIVGANNPPSSFINSNNTLNNTVVEQVVPANFTVSRQANQTACAADGNCTNATFAGINIVQSVAYTSLSPVVCVIPPALLSGLF